MHEARVELAGTPSSVGAARRFAREVLDSGGVSDDDWTVVQVVSELATNAVVHARTSFVVTISYDETRIRVAVADSKPLARATIRRFSDNTTTGRGLRLIQLLGESWGVDQSDLTKTVWCELRRDALAVDDVETAFEALGLSFDDDVATEGGAQELGGRVSVCASRLAA